MQRIEVAITGKVIGNIADAQDRETAEGQLVLSVEMAANTHCVGRLHLQRASARYYVLVIHGGTDTELHGGDGLDSAESRDVLAREIYSGVNGEMFRPEYDSIFRVRITETGAPQITSFQHGFFGNE